MLFKNSASFIVLMGFGLTVNAQAPNSSKPLTDTTRKLNEVIVQENRLQLPFSKQNRNIWIIDSEKIKSLPARSISELLSYVSGIDVRQRGPGGSQADISIDGGTFDETLVLLNGVKVSDPQTGHHMMNLPISMDDIDHIEVLRGSASRVYGINALTGAINIVTRKVQKTGISANVFAGSSFKQKEGDGGIYVNSGQYVSGTLALKASSHLFSMGQETGNGYRYNTAFNNQKLYYQGKVNVGKTDQLDVMAGYIYNKFGANGFYAAPGDKDAEETVKTALAAIAYSTKITENWTMTPRISYRNNVDDYIYTKKNPSLSHNHHATNVWDAELNNTIQTSIGTFGLGLEARTEYIKSASLGKRNRSNTGFYGEYKFEPFRKVSVNVGAYTNYNSDYGWQAFPGLDIGYDIYDNWRIYGNVGTGQRLPTYTDLYYAGKGNIGNDQLVPEKSKYAEGGIKFNNAHFSGNLSYFSRRIDHFIDWVKDKITDPYQPKNYSEVNTNGLTLSGDYRWTATAGTRIINGFRLGASYTYLDPEIKTTISNVNFSRYALRSLKNQLSGTLTTSFCKVMDLTLAARYQDRISYKDYTVIDAKLAFKKPHYSIYADASNLFNAQFIEAEAIPMPGTWYTLGFKVNY
ncbi:TonB-dependent receptor plug domain-containing protein [Pedobacter gandavensis]|uniref:TonB-dependent receptor plug domain-containing protein n=1 Tax=Pedobacter gandavensis TaxID=2679963 RepID=UPI00292D8934|nr:TonB-dependent receptor [Pedobacter gandavensis]